MDFLAGVEEVAENLQATFSNTSSPDKENVQVLLLDVEVMVNAAIQIQPIFPVAQCITEALQRHWLSLIEVLEMFFRKRQQRGRPEILIREEQLMFLLGLHFSVTNIAHLYNVSSRTVRRRIIQYELDENKAFSDICDATLDELSKEFVSIHPNCGSRTLAGFLRSMGYRIQRQRVRESVRRVDPRGVEARFRRALHRRSYSVPMPNSLWHIDGYHKLIKWRIIIYGGIDGYSRLPVFIRASSNNTSETVLMCFLNAVDNYGLPSRVRCDKGGENVLVTQYMINHPLRGPGRRRCITGRRVHNQRIERLWRDLYVGCVSLFYEIFNALEDSDLLDCHSEVDMFTLHYVFLPRLNKQLHVFRDAYAHHRLRTCRNQSPFQIWTRGLLEGQNDSDAIDGMSEDDVVSGPAVYKHKCQLN